MIYYMSGKIPIENNFDVIEFDAIVVAHSEEETKELFRKEFKCNNITYISNMATWDEPSIVMDTR